MTLVNNCLKQRKCLFGLKEKEDNDFLNNCIIYNGRTKN